MPPGLLVRSLAATALSYFALVGRDAVALRYIGAKVPGPLLWIGTVAGSALGNAVGFGALTGGAVRYRVYGAVGVSAAQVARLSALTGATFAFGLAVLSGLGLTSRRRRSAPCWARRRWRCGDVDWRCWPGERC